MESWKEISREEVFNKYQRGIEKVVYHLPGGKQADFYVSSGHPSVACLALTKDKQVILVKQFRPGPGKFILDLPGGGIEAGENPKQAMERELFEETGYRGTVKFLTTILPSAYASYIKNALVVTECEEVGKSQIEDNGESLETVLMSLEEFRKHLRSGQFHDVEIGYLGLDYLQLL